MATSEGIPSSIDIEFLELNDNPYVKDSIEPDIKAAATEGTIKITKNQGIGGQDFYTIEYELKDDSNPKNTVKATWLGKIKIYAY